MLFPNKNILTIKNYIFMKHHYCCHKLVILLKEQFQYQVLQPAYLNINQVIRGYCTIFLPVGTTIQEVPLPLFGSFIKIFANRIYLLQRVPPLLSSKYSKMRILITSRYHLEEAPRPLFKMVHLKRDFFLHRDISFKDTTTSKKRIVPSRRYHLQELPPPLFFPDVPRRRRWQRNG